MTKCQFYLGDTLIPQGRVNVVRSFHEMFVELVIEVVESVVEVVMEVL